ncbi:MAG TPA: tRNA-binding protein [Thermoflexia bacterium]|nr:tRNA-binding protein [Thermoflexia bacterium]
MIDYADFLQVEIHTGTITAARRHPRARQPAYILTVDFGALGVKTSSAQLTVNYTAEELVGQQIVAVTNFPPKRIAGVKSEVLILEAVDEEHDVVLIAPLSTMEDGTRIL